MWSEQLAIDGGRRSSHSTKDSAIGIGRFEDTYFKFALLYRIENKCEKQHD